MFAIPKDRKKKKVKKVKAISLNIKNESIMDESSCFSTDYNFK